MQPFPTVSGWEIPFAQDNVMVPAGGPVGGSGQQDHVTSRPCSPPRKWSRERESPLEWRTTWPAEGAVGRERYLCLGLLFLPRLPPTVVVGDRVQVRGSPSPSAPSSQALVTCKGERWVSLVLSLSPSHLPSWVSSRRPLLPLCCWKRPHGGGSQRGARTAARGGGEIK